MKIIEKVLLFIENEKITKAELERNSGLSNGYLNNILKSNSEISTNKLKDIKKAYPGLESFIETIPNKETGDDLRNQKAMGKSREEGLKFVPIPAQAGYALHYMEPQFVSDLATIDLPNMPYRGNRYRIFEVKGDSMEPTLKEHFHVVGELVDQEDWHNTANFYIYVVVTIDRIMIKRLFRKDDDTYVCISDNKDFYPQFAIKKHDIKELWLVKRKMDWEMPPPQKFEITI